MLGSSRVRKHFFGEKGNENAALFSLPPETTRREGGDFTFALSRRGEKTRGHGRREEETEMERNRERGGESHASSILLGRSSGQGSFQESN